MTISKPPDRLLAGRRALDGLSGVEILEDWAWFEGARQWGLKVRLEPGDLGSAVPVPASTDWYILAEPSYEWGSIGFYPAIDAGLSQTFPHQLFNGPGTVDLPWRQGMLCLTTPGKPLGRLGEDPEPYDVDRRLVWHTERAMEWVRCASNGTLLKRGDPFELPHFPMVATPQGMIAFSEGIETLPTWTGVPDRCGLVDLVSLDDGLPGTMVVSCFRTTAGAELWRPSWGRVVSNGSRKVLRAGWIRLPTVPVLSPWQAPVTWGDLWSFGSKQGIDLADLIRRVAPHLRDGKPHVVLIGCPIPATVDGEMHEMHWQALELPPLTRTGAPNGFRENERGWWQSDRTKILAPSRPIAWKPSENWHPERLGARGMLPLAARSHRIALIGAGALGSVVAELLVRAGLATLVILDGEALSAGNLVRHTLTVDAVGSSKATALADRLNRASPHADVTAITTHFPPADAKDRAALADCDVVIDCTGMDDLLGLLEQYEWPAPRLFVSLSLGYRARRLFGFTVQASRFPLTILRENVVPWLEVERSEAGDFPWEGPGCWHPIFPARAEDIWMMAAAAVRMLERRLATPQSAPDFFVFEQTDQDDFMGVRRAESPERTQEAGIPI